LEIGDHQEIWEQSEKSGLPSLPRITTGINNVNVWLNKSSVSAPRIQERAAFHTKKIVNELDRLSDIEKMTEVLNSNPKITTRLWIVPILDQIIVEIFVLSKEIQSPNLVTTLLSSPEIRSRAHLELSALNQGATSDLDQEIIDNLKNTPEELHRKFQEVSEEYRSEYPIELSS
jgi:hypothetical protein